MELDPRQLTRHLTQALEEDLGEGDPTTETTVEAEQQIEAEIIAGDPGVLAGKPVVERLSDVFSDLYSAGSPDWDWLTRDGKRFQPEDVILRLNGSARGILMLERTLLNYLQQLSGIATLTRKYVQVAQPYDVRVMDTRKTVPHYRQLQKYAVRVGGGDNHRMNLGQGIMIKDNHKRLAGGLSQALETVSGPSPLVVEIHSTEELKQLSQDSVDVIMLDNFSPEEIKSNLESIPDDVTVEASGGINLNNLEAYARTGIDQVSVGRLTHSFSSIDFSLGLVTS